MFGKEKKMKMEDEGFANLFLRTKRLMNKFLELENKLEIVEGVCANMRSQYEAKVAVSRSPSSDISEIGECDHLIGQGVNEVISNVNNNKNTAIDVIVLSDDESNDDGNQEEQCRIRANSSTQNRDLGEAITPMAANHPQPLPASSSAS